MTNFRASHSREFIHRGVAGFFVSENWRETGLTKARKP